MQAQLIRKLQIRYTKQRKPMNKAKNAVGKIVSTYPLMILKRIIPYDE